MRSIAIRCVHSRLIARGYPPGRFSTRLYTLGCGMVATSPEKFMILREKERKITEKEVD